MLDYPRTGAIVKSPPITKVCRLLRQETLPIFYDSQTLHIGMRYVAWISRTGTVKRYLGRYGVSMKSPSHRFLTNAPPTVIRMIKKLAVYVETYSRVDDRTWDNGAAWDITLSSKDDTHTLTSKPWEKEGGSPDVRSVFEPLIRAQLDAMVTRQGGLRLMRRDGESLRMAVQVYLQNKAAEHEAYLRKLREEAEE